MTDTASNKRLRKPKYLSPAQLARLQGCSERTIREWCKRDLIQEAYQTRGGHWRIRMPLSIKTRYELEKRSPDWPFRGMKKGRDIIGDFEPDFAEWHALAQLYERPIDQDIPVPYIAELGDFSETGLLDNRPDRKAEIARKIQDAIMQKLQARTRRQNIEARKFFSRLILMGSVYQFWREKQHLPTVLEIADFMGLSRAAFYRRYTRQELNRAYRDASNQAEVHLRDQQGLDAVQKANLKAKKPGFAALHRDLC